MISRDIYEYTISYEALVDKKITRKIRDLMQKLHKVGVSGAKNGKKRIEKAIAEYPDIPQFKNYLSGWYSVRGELEKAFECNRQIILQHPDYLFAKTNLAQEYLEKGQPEKVVEILGQEIEIKQIYPEREEFHVSEVTTVLGIAIQYYIQTDDLEQASARLELLEEVAPGSGEIERFQTQLFLKMFENSPLFNQRESQRTSIIQPDTVKTEAPVFQHPQIEWLYKQPSLTREQMTEMLGLPRQSLMKDLEKVLKDSVERYSYFEDTITDDHHGNFVLHSLFLLRELKAEESLPAVLEVLAQSEEYLDLFLGSFLTENIWEILLVLAENNLALLLDFAMRPNVYTYSKSQLTQAVAQTALYLPERHPKAVRWFRDLFNFYINVETDVIDPVFMGLAISDVLDFGGIELKEEIKTLFEKDYVDKMSCGDWASVHKCLKNPQPKKYDFITLKEVYELLSIDETIEDDIAYEYRGANVDNENKGILNLTAGVPYIKPKTPGRNDPCFCGSGKKYKKCCM